MASQTPPNGQYSHHSHPSSGTGYGSENASESGGKSPLAMSLGFLKTLTEKKTTRVDGQAPKRRGPKPDSKPALTRRQEMNRQAQRTHRERKELYIKALEEEVLRLKETFSNASKSKEALAEENQRLKALLAQHGIPWDGIGGIDEYTRSSSNGYPSTGSMSGSHTTPSTAFTPPHQHSAYDGPSPSQGSNGMNYQAQQQMPRPDVDHDQAGIDFVLTLERPCMDHMQFLVARAAGEGGESCGHALMASCPPVPSLDDRPDIPFGHGNNQAPGTVQKTWDISKSDLANLLDLSKRLNLNGEITPVMAWGLILGHDRFLELSVDDFASIAKDLGAKSRCYGFGAVLEEFELRDAVESVLSSKPDMIMSY